MAYNFPDSPSNGDTFTLNGVTYAYSSAKGVWKDTAVGVLPATTTSSDAAPTSPRAGDLWYKTDDSSLFVYYNDGSSSQWVAVSGPSGPAGNDGVDGSDGADGSSVTAYANFAAVPTSGNTVGDFAFTSDTKALYVWDGAEWDRVALGNDESPVITTEPPTTEVALNFDGTTSTVTMVAEDPEGFDITYGIAYKTANNARPSQLSADTTINQSTGVYTFTPSTTEANAGTFRARLSASDGARITTRLVDFKLKFFPIESSAITAQYHFYDTNSYDAATSTTALNDLSGNSNTMTITNPGSSTTAGNVGALQFNTNTSINFNTISADTKSMAIIFYPPTGFNTTLLIGQGSLYRHTFSSSQSADYGQGFGAWSGATVFDRINGFDHGNNRATAYNRLTLDQYNSVISNGVNYGSTFLMNSYSGWTGQYHVRAIVMFNRFITEAEMEDLHDYYKNGITSGGGTMGAWGV